MPNSNKNTIGVTLRWCFWFYKTAKINYSKHNVKIINYAYKGVGVLRTSGWAGVYKYIAVLVCSIQVLQE